VEFAFVLPILMTLLLGIWEVGRLIHVKQIISNAAREGGRAASTGLRDNAAIRSIVTTYLTNSNIANTTGLVVNVTNLTTGVGPTYNPTLATQLDEIQVEVQLPFDNVKWIIVPQKMTSATSITSKAIWYSSKNVPIIVDLSGKNIPLNPN